MQEGYFSMASSDNRLDAKSSKIYGENITKPKVDKRLHDKRNTHSKVNGDGLDSGDNGILDKIAGTVH